MSISVVLATYNRAPLLEQALEQLREQDYEPGDEVIVVDNGSTDGTADVISRAARTSPVPVRQIFELARGKGPALEAAVAAARGDVLAFMDDDVLVARDWIATIRRLFSDPSRGIVGGRVDPWWERPAPRWLRAELESGYSAVCSPLALVHYGDAQPLASRTAVGGNLVVRRTIFDALGGFAAHLAPRSGTLLRIEDHDFSQRAVTAGIRCEYYPELRVRHWVPADRMRLRYFLRWFFWSGFGHALLGTDDPIGRDGRRRPVPGYYLRQLVVASMSAAAHALRGQSRDATERATDAAFALGYVTQRVRDVWTGWYAALRRQPHRTQLVRVKQGCSTARAASQPPLDATPQMMQPSPAEDASVAE